MEFLNKIYFDNAVRNLLWVGGIILFVFLSKRYLSRYVASIVYKFANRILRNVDKKNFIDLVVEPIEWFLLVTISVFAIDKLNFPTQFRFKIYGHTSEDIIARIGPGIMILTFVWLVLRLIDFIALVLEQRANLTPDTRDIQLIVFFRDFLKVIIGIVGLLWLIKASFYQPIGNVLTGLSIVGAGLALAAKESLENLIASFIIFFDKPFFTGDYVKVNAITGTVEQIGLRSTRIRTADKTLITVPNKQMVDSMVDNWSMRTARRAEIRLELHPSTPTVAIEKFKAFVTDLLEADPLAVVTFDVVLKDFNRNAVVIVTEYFTAPIPLQDFDALKEHLLLSIMKKIEQENLVVGIGNAGVLA